MLRKRRGRFATLFVRGSAAVGLLVGWRVAAGESMPRVTCGAAGRPQRRLAECFSHSLRATAVHWAVPMALGLLLAGGLALALVVTVRELRTATRAA
jgi:hypothetical protein